MDLSHFCLQIVIKYCQSLDLDISATRRASLWTLISQQPEELERCSFVWLKAVFSALCGMVNYTDWKVGERVNIWVSSTPSGKLGRPANLFLYTMCLCVYAYDLLSTYGCSLARVYHFLISLFKHFYLGSNIIATTLAHMFLVLQFHSFFIGIYRVLV